jgi:hypothetical protein
MDISTDELASALIRNGWFFPSQWDAAVIAAQDLLDIIRERRR